LDALLAVQDPVVAETLRAAVEAARKCEAQPPPRAPRTTEQRLQSAVDRRLHAKAMLDNAAWTFAEHKKALEEAEAWLGEKATLLAEAQAEETAALRQRNEEAGNTHEVKEAQVLFDFSLPDGIEELEQDAQDTLREMVRVGQQQAEESLANYKANCKAQLDRISKDVEMEIAKVKKRKVESKGGEDKPVPGTADELMEAAAPGAASSKPAAGLERAAAAPAAEASPATPTQAQLDTQRAAIELGNAAKQAAIARLQEQTEAKEAKSKDTAGPGVVSAVPGDAAAGTQRF